MWQEKRQMYEALRNRKRTIGAACLSLFFCLPSALAAPAASFTIHDFMPDFWKFWQAAENQPVERRAQLWQSLYVNKHQAVFDDLAGPCKDQYDPAWANARYFPNLPKIVPAMRDATNNLPEKMGAAQDRFLRMFPDMQWAGDVYVMASGYCFTGRAQSIQGRGAILLGMDARVALGLKDLAPTMAHELFHRYHRPYFDYEGSSNYPLWTLLWAEGMAQYVAEELNPGASDADLVRVPIGIVQRVDSKRQELAADFLKRFDSREEMDAKIYFNDTNSKDPFVPARAGYQLGVLIVRDLAKQYPIQTMAHWSQSEVRPKIRQALAAIARLPNTQK
jgi:hypothetical protein